MAKGFFQKLLKPTDKDLWPTEQSFDTQKTISLLNNNFYKIPHSCYWFVTPIMSQFYACFYLAIHVCLLFLTQAWSLGCGEGGGLPGLSPAQASSQHAGCELHLQPGLTAQFLNSIEVSKLETSAVSGRRWNIWLCWCHSARYSSCCWVLALGIDKKARALLSQDWHVEEVAQIPSQALCEFCSNWGLCCPICHEPHINCGRLLEKLCRDLSMKNRKLDSVLYKVCPNQTNLHEMQAALSRRLGNVSHPFYTSVL